jgi:F-type H+-transporting ATPase subunit delta
MGPTIIARNYAETLLTLGERHGGDAAVDEFGQALDELAELMRTDPRVSRFLSTPRIDGETRKRVLREALGEQVPEVFLRFLLIVVEKRRQMLLPHIANEYQALVDEARGRVRADISIAREPGPEFREEIVADLERRLGRSVVARFRVDRSIIGGAVIRVGEQILDGSVRRRMTSLRHRMLHSRLPRVAPEDVVEAGG